MSPSTPLIALTTMAPESSQLHGFGYDPATGTLAVEYKSNRSEATYHYQGVPPALFDELQAAESKGSVLSRVRSGFDFVRIDKASAVVDETSA